MVAFSSARGGSFSFLLKPFKVGERHRLQYLVGKPYSYLGPGTDLRKREALHDDTPINQLDVIAKKTRLFIR